MEDSDDPGFLAAGEARLTRLICPECNGALAEVDLPRISFYRCHVGHQFGPQTLAAAQAEAAERKLWGAVAALEDHAALARYLSERASTVADGTASDYRRAADRAATLAKSVRSTLHPTDSEDVGARRRPPERV